MRSNGYKYVKAPHSSYEEPKHAFPFILAHFGCILVILHAFAAVLCLLWSRFVWFLLFCIWYCCCLSDLGCFTFCCSRFVSNFSSGTFVLMVILWSHFLNTNQLPNVVFVCICLFLRVCICCSFSTDTEFEKYSNTSSRQVIHHLLTLTLFFLRIYIQAVILLR